MPYLTEDDYVARFGAEELEQVLSSSEGATLDAAAADAQSIVDSYLAAMGSRSFAVPLTLDPVPPRIVEITADLTRYELYGKRPTKEIEARRAEAMAFLEALLAGTVVIPELLPDAGAAPPAGSIDYTAEPRVFDSCSLAGYLGQ